MTQLADLTRPGRRLPRLGRAASGRRARRRHPPLVSVVILLFVLAMSLFASMIAPDSPLKINLSGALVPPFYAKGGSFAHVLGTDNLGRDILSRIVYGARETLLLAVIVLLVGGIVGVILGLLSGYYGGAIDGLIQRLVEAILSLPTIMVALVFAYVLGQSTRSIVIVLSPFIAAQFARMVRGDVLGVKALGYVDLARVRRLCAPNYGSPHSAECRRYDNRGIHLGRRAADPARSDSELLGSRRTTSNAGVGADGF